MEPTAKDSLGMRVLVDAVKVHSWGHLFEWTIPILHKWEVREFYLNLKIHKDGGFVTSVREISFRVDEEILSDILKVNRKGIRTVVDKSPTKNFLEEARKMKNLNLSAVSKKFLKGQYQLYFEFVNKVLLPRIEKRTIATMVDINLMEKFSTLVEINPLALMMEHMTKVLNMTEGKYGLAYGYLLNRVFEYYSVQLSREIWRIVKKSLSYNTLVECECGNLKAEVRKSPMSDLIDQKEALKGQVEELTAALTKKDVKLLC